MKIITPLLIHQEYYLDPSTLLTWTTLILTIYNLHTLTKTKLPTTQNLSSSEITCNLHKQNNINHLPISNTHPLTKNINTNPSKIHATYHPYLSKITYTLIVILIITQLHYNTPPTHNTQLTTPPQTPHKTYQYQLHPQQQNHKSSITSIYPNVPHTTPHPIQHKSHQTYTPIIPHIQTITFLGHFYYITHTHLKCPKYKLIQHYIWNNSKIILLSGDIESNPGPLSHIIKNLPQEYAQRQKLYFEPNTLTLKPHYAHLEELFKPYLTHTIPNPNQNDLAHLRNHMTHLANYQPHHLLYAIIISYSPIPHVCNQQMSENLDPRCLTILRELSNLPNTTHANNLYNAHHHTHNTPPTIPQAYTQINQMIAQGTPITIENLSKEIPHLPKQLLQEFIKCPYKIRGYHPTPFHTHTNYTSPSNTNPCNHQTTSLKLITWNAGCINSSLPGIQELTRKLHTGLHIIFIQETKLHAHKSTSYIDRKFQDYKIIYNNSNNVTHKQNKYSGPTLARGGILTMIPKSIYTNENIQKIPTPNTISPYLQAIIINNKPLTPILVMNMYMPTHPQDIHLIQEIQNQIQTLATQHQHHQIFLVSDFNRDILLKGRLSNAILSTPTQNDYDWHNFTQNNGLQVIKNPHSLTRQGGHNYTSTSHIDGFYTTNPTHNTWQCHTLTNLNQNSDHYPVQLQLAPNNIVLKDTTTQPITPRITYPIPLTTIQKLQTTFLETQNLAIDNLTTTLLQDTLTHDQWEDAQNKLQEITNILSQCIEDICMTKPTPPLPNRAKIQGGFLPRTLQKTWKHQLKIHHSIRKAIRSTCQHPHTNLPNNPDIKALQSLKNIIIPPLPNNHANLHHWIEELANMGKNAKAEAHKITTKQTKINCKKTIHKYRILLNLKPKTIHKKIFQPTTTNSLDCLQNLNGHTLTQPTEIAKEIYHTQQNSFQRQAPLCDDVADHPSTCMCAVRKYP